MDSMLIYQEDVVANRSTSVMFVSKKNSGNLSKMSVNLQQKAQIAFELLN